MPHDIVCIENLSADEVSATPQSDRGASIVEYALLVALIAVVCIGAVTFFGTATGGSLSTSGSSMFIPSS